MNISAQLTHLDDRLAVCMVTLQDGDKRISLYASALAAESGLYPDLAQKRAVELALRFYEMGAEVFRDLEISAQPLPARVRPSVAPTDEVQEFAPPQAVRLDDEEPASIPVSPADTEDAPW